MIGMGGITISNHCCTLVEARSDRLSRLDPERSSTALAISLLQDLDVERKQTWEGAQHGTESRGKDMEIVVL
jgi:hypothetical protein